MTIATVAVTAMLHTGLFVGFDYSSTQDALSRHGTMESNRFGTTGAIVVESVAFTGLDLAAQAWAAPTATDASHPSFKRKQNWFRRASPWIVRTISAGVAVGLKIHNDRMGR